MFALTLDMVLSTPSRVLVIDPDGTARQQITQTFERAGHTVRSSGHALEALTQLSVIPIDVVLSNERLPGRDGRWLAAQIGQSHPAVRVILYPPHCPPQCPVGGVSGPAIARHDRRDGLRRTVRRGVCGLRIGVGRDCAVIDIAPGGALIESESRLRPGACVDVQLADHRRRATIVRCYVSSLGPDRITYRAGVQFDARLGTPVLDTLVDDSDDAAA